MKKIVRILACAASLALMASCGPSRYAVHVEMRHPSRTGIDLADKNVSVICLTNDNTVGSAAGEAISEGFAKALENEYGTGEGSVGVYSVKALPGGDYASKDTLFNFLMDTGADLVFLLDTLTVGDSESQRTGTIPYSIRLYCFDGMDSSENVYAFGTGGTLTPSYVITKDMSDAARQSLCSEAKTVGTNIASSFEPQWKHEQYSILYFETEKWYDALARAASYDWTGAMNIWLDLAGSRDILKRSSAAYNISVACYMLGNYKLALEWLDMSDSESKLTFSDAMRKRINQRLNR